MLFKRKVLEWISIPLLSLAFSSGFSGCGALGDKAPAKSVFRQDNGCFDQLSERVKRYFNGEIEVSEWEATFVCVDNQISYFRKYVRGESPEGFNPADIGDLIRRFLITNRTVSDSFIRSVFDLKASVFGGNNVIITPLQIDEFLAFSKVLKRESLLLIPALRARRRNPTPESFLQLTTALEGFGTNLAEYFSGLHGTFDVPKTSTLPFIRELILIHGGDASLVDKYGDFAHHLKVIIAGGDPEKIEHQAWPFLVKAAADLGGLFLAYTDEDKLRKDHAEETDRLYIELLSRFQTYAKKVIARNGNSIPLSLIDPLIDTLPSDGFTSDRRDALKHDLRQIIFRAFQSGVKDTFTQAALTNIMNIAEQGLRLQVHLKRVYRALPVAPQKKELEVALRVYAKTLTTSEAIADVEMLIENTKNFVGLFTEDSGEMLFNATIRETRTRNHMIRISWYRIMIDYLFSVYATGPERTAGHKAASVTDLSNLTSDALQILEHWKLAHPDETSLSMATKRFREGNLFMPGSNGDQYFENREAVYYVAFLVSANGFSNRIFTEITQNRAEWSACPILGVDPLGQDAMEAQCFRAVYFGHPEIFWTNFPALQVAYAGMTSMEKKALADSMETAGRRGGKSEDPIGPFDINSFAALPHYVEDMMEQFDHNADQVLDKREILDVAFPIFRETLSIAAKTNSTFLLKGILTYIIHKGVPPKNSADLIWWTTALLPFTKVVADRNAVYNIVALLSSPIDLSKNASTSGSDSSWPLMSSGLHPVKTSPTGKPILKSELFRHEKPLDSL